MAQEEQRCKFQGVLLGLVQCSHGTSGIAFNVQGQQTILSFEAAAIVFDQLGDLLAAVGYFDDEPEGQAQGGPVCH